jgi:hypothetical protein
MDFSPTPELIEEELRIAIRERKQAHAEFERSMVGGAHRMTAAEHAMAVDSFQSLWERWQAAENRVTELIRMAGPDMALRVVADEETGDGDGKRG